MSGYPEGKHDEPADTQDRLIKVGTKYQATAPAVADGDNVYLMVDSAGRVLIAGAVASDAAAAGNPVQVGGVVDDTSPTAAAEGDARSFRSTPEGNQIVELYKDNNALSPITAMPGASEVKAKRLVSGNPDTTRTTVLPPTSGKKIRVIALVIWNTSATDATIECYFGTGAQINTDDTKAIFEAGPSDNTVDTGNYRLVLPDGAGPVGAVDDVVSLRSNTDLTSGIRGQLFYREE